MRTAALKVAAAFVGANILCCTIVGAFAQQPLPVTALDALYQRYKPRIQQLTPAIVEKMWTTQSRNKPWFQATYTLLSEDKDNPQLIDKLRREIPCGETNFLTRDATYSSAAGQYRCTVSIPMGNYKVDVVLYLNFKSAGTLESAVVYQGSPAKSLVEEEAAKGTSRNDIPAIIELHSDLMSRIDNARAPPGSYVEYSKNMEAKFAVRFK
jgi:hypothetical protein